MAGSVIINTLSFKKGVYTYNHEIVEIRMNKRIIIDYNTIY